MTVPRATVHPSTSEWTPTPTTKSALLSGSNTIQVSHYFRWYHRVPLHITSYLMIQIIFFRGSKRRRHGHRVVTALVRPRKAKRVPRADRHQGLGQSGHLGHIDAHRRHRWRQRQQDAAGNQRDFCLQLHGNLALFSLIFIVFHSPLENVFVEKD